MKNMMIKAAFPVLVFFLIGVNFATPPPIEKTPSLLVITIDTWRWDYIGVSGQGKVATPNLDKLAREGLYEREAVTPCPLTTPAHASIFTGLLPQNHGILDCVGFSLKPGKETLAEAFKKAGYSTAAFVSSDSVVKRFGLDRGFDLYDDSGIGRRSKDDWQYGTKDGAVTTYAAIQFISRNEGRPLFLWVHLYDMHAPYRRRAKYDALYPGNIYAAEAAFIDDQVGRLVSACRSNFRILVVGDHGEGLGDHGETGHGMALYSSTMHVPLILFPAPGQTFLHGKPWGLIDIDPTVREWFGLPKGEEVDGSDLFLSKGKDRHLQMMTMMPTFTFGVEPVLGIRKGAYAYLKSGSEELYDLAADPLQNMNLAPLPEMKGTLSSFRALCDLDFQDKSLQAIMTPTLKSSAEELKNLMGLGYIGGTAPNLSALRRADMKTILTDWNFLQLNWEEGYKNKNAEQVKTAFARMAEKYPDAPIILRTLGKFSLKSGDYARALATYERLVKSDPEDQESLVNLGTLYLMQGKADRARVVLEAAEKLDPDDSACQKNLGLLYGDILKMPDKAIPHYLRYLKLEPSSPDAPKIRDYINKQAPAGK